MADTRPEPPAPDAPDAPDATDDGTAPDEDRGAHPPRVPELDRRRAGRLPRVLLGVALALPVLLVVGVLVASQVITRGPEPDDPGTDRLPVATVPVPDAASADCARFLSGIPDSINAGGALLARRVLAEPSPPGTVAWGGTNRRSGRPEDQPLVLRCGLSRPAELTPTAALLDIDGVEWVAVRDPAAQATTWVTADRAVYVGLTVPDGAGSAPIQDVSRGVKITLTSRPING